MSACVSLKVGSLRVFLTAEQHPTTPGVRGSRTSDRRTGKGLGRVQKGAPLLRAVGARHPRQPCVGPCVCVHVALAPVGHTCGRCAGQGAAGGEGGMNVMPFYLYNQIIAQAANKLDEPSNPLAKSPFLK